jgi:hypothetical protein
MMDKSYKLSLLLNILSEIANNKTFSRFVDHWNMWRLGEDERRPDPTKVFRELADSNDPFISACRMALIAAKQYLDGEGIPDLVLYNVASEIRRNILAVMETPTCMPYVMATTIKAAMQFSSSADFYIWAEDFLRDPTPREIFTDIERHAALEEPTGSYLLVRAARTLYMSEEKAAFEGYSKDLLKVAIEYIKKWLDLFVEYFNE